MMFEQNFKWLIPNANVGTITYKQSDLLCPQNLPLWGYNYNVFKAAAIPASHHDIYITRTTVAPTRKMLEKSHQTFLGPNCSQGMSGEILDLKYSKTKNNYHSSLVIASSILLDEQRSQNCSVLLHRLLLKKCNCFPCFRKTIWDKHG